MSQRCCRETRTIPRSWSFSGLVITLVFFIAALGLHPFRLHGAASYFRADGGLARATNSLPEDLDAAEALRWRVQLDTGHSTPIVHGGKIFLTTYRPASKELATVALDEASGKELWRRPMVPEQVEQTHQLGSPATATVACDGERVFAFFGSMGAVCYDLAGKKLWEQRMGPFRDEYGAGSSPIIFEGKLILNQDHDLDSFLIALDCATGRVLWKTPRPDAFRSYSTPTIWMKDGRAQILVAGALQLSAYDPADGRQLWWLNGLARIVIPTPVASGPMVYMASWAPGADPGGRVTLDPWPAALAKWDADRNGKLSREEIDNGQVLERYYRMDLDQNKLLDKEEWERYAAVFVRAKNAVLAVRPTGNGELKEEAVVWKYERGVPYVATPVLDRGILWMVKDGGIVTKLDAATGNMLQEERIPGRGNYFASPVTGGGKVYFASEPGVVSILSAERDWKLISSHDFHERIYATPAIVRDRLYIRTEQALYLFQRPAAVSKP